MIQVHVKQNFENINIDIKFQVKLKSFVAISGKSGAGKSTLLRMIAGLQQSYGYIKVGDYIYQDDKYNLCVQKRNIGYVFQNYALFPNMSVLQNLLFINKNMQKAMRLLDICEISHLKNENIAHLSGGQKQRVALCRAFMRQIDILLLDEPLSALDENLRAKLQQQILQLHKEFNTTTFMVSHDTSEIYKLADDVILLENGKVKKQASPTQMFLHTKGSQKFSFEGEILELRKVDVIIVATIVIAKQIVQIVLSEDEACGLKVGDFVTVSTKAFNPSISK